MDNFIGVYENAIPDELCDELIEAFKYAEAIGVTKNRMQREGTSAKFKKDSSCFSSEFAVKHHSVFAKLVDTFWIQYEQYKQKYSESLQDSCDEYRIYTAKLQKTVPGDGYHVWHFENGSRAESNRIVTWTIYLNDVEEGGETEFLYQAVRVKPKKGTLCLFPAAYTHLHRGNPPMSGEKYIATGWLEL